MHFATGNFYFAVAKTGGSFAATSLTLQWQSCLSFLQLQNLSVAKKKNWCGGAWGRSVTAKLARSLQKRTSCFSSCKISLCKVHVCIWKSVFADAKVHFAATKFAAAVLPLWQRPPVIELGYGYTGCLNVQIPYVASILLVHVKFGCLINGYTPLGAASLVLFRAFRCSWNTNKTPRAGRNKEKGEKKRKEIKYFGFWRGCMILQTKL